MGTSILFILLIISVLRGSGRSADQDAGGAGVGGDGGVLVVEFRAAPPRSAAPECRYGRVLLLHISLSIIIFGPKQINR